MTRKDYQTFAGSFMVLSEAIRDQALTLFLEARRRNPEVSASYVLETMLKTIVADIFARDNPRFDRERFFQACLPRE